MKHVLIAILETLLAPLIWCARTLREASELCCCYEPVGFSDYVRFRGETRNRDGFYDLCPGHVTFSGSHAGAGAIPAGWVSRPQE